MKCFFQLRRPKALPFESPDSVLVVELGPRDMVKLLLGREIVTTSTAIRLQPAYDAFNLAARPVDENREKPT